MKLLTLTLENFKGVRAFTLETGGSSATVYGDNATGKTTLSDAFSWLLFGKDSLGRADFGIKTLKADGKPHHRLSHSVEATLEHDGQTLTLRRVYKEKWTRQRGSSSSGLTGHETEYLIDGVPMRKLDYDRRIAEIASEETFRLLTDTQHFHRLHWQDRRRILVDLIDDVREEDVLAREPRLKRLADVLNGRSPEEAHSVIDAARKRLNTELTEIPIRVDETTKALPSLTDDRDAILIDLEASKSRTEELRERIASARVGTAAEARDEASKARAALVDHEERRSRDRNAALKAFREDHAAAASRLSAAERDRARLEERLEADEEKLATLSLRREELRAAYRARHALPYEPITAEDTCPHCGQSLPAERVEAARESAKAAWNEERATFLARIQEDGKRLSAQIDALDSAIADLRVGITDAEAAVTKAKAEEAARAKALGDAERVSDDPEGQSLRNALESAEAKLRRAEDGVAADVSPLLAEVGEETERRRALETLLAKHDAADRLRERLLALEAREKVVAEEYEKAMRDLDLLDLYARTKAELLTAEINKRFELATFRLYRDQINGGLEPTCETVVNGVPYDDLNYGMRLNVGLDIIATLSDYHAFSPPVFVDNAEAVTSLLPLDGQMIRLRVSEDDAALRVVRHTED